MTDGGPSMYDAPLRVRITPEYPSLVISSEGDIRGPSGKWLKLFPSKTNPYLHFTIYSAGKWTQLQVHVVVCTAFHGPRPAGMITRHLNGDPRDNRAENLRWGTFEENEADKAKHDRNQIGERHHSAKLTEDQVRAIRAVPRRRGSGKSLAHRYGISEAAISAIRLRKVWRHL